VYLPGLILAESVGYELTDTFWSCVAIGLHENSTSMRQLHVAPYLVFRSINLAAALVLMNNSYCKRL